MSLSVVGFGCWAAGKKWWGNDVDDELSVAAIHTALDVGINWFDTAPLYGHGHADEILRRALGTRAKDVIIASKCGVRWDGPGEHAQSDLRPDHVRWDVEESLHRLGVDTIDLMQVHWPCELGTPIEDTLGTLEDLQDEGKIRHFGVCNYNAEGLETALAASARLVSLQCGYSMIRREFEHGPRPICLEADVGVLAYEPLGRGLLTGKFRGFPLHFPETDLRLRDARFHGERYLRIRTLVHDLTVIAHRARTSPAALAIGWVCTRPGVTAAIFGAKSPEQVLQNVQAVNLLEKRKLWDFLDPVVDTYRG
jgi:aryl-alcohol dehydrogenase-like predicted oxidoreductase